MQIIDGDLSIDDRGKITFVNDFDFADVKRFYMIENHEKGFIRAWHGHQEEGKYVLVINGTIILGIVPFDGTNEEVQRFILSASKPQVIYIPPRNFNGFKTLTEDAKIMFFSTSTLEESMRDDIRKPAMMWSDSGIWKVESR